MKFISKFEQMKVWKMALMTYFGILRQPVAGENVKTTEN
jgi:hypothetical protein